MRSISDIFWLTLLGLMASLAWNAAGLALETEPTNVHKQMSNSKIKNLARKQYRATNSWGRRVTPGATHSKPGRYYDEDSDEDEDDQGNYGYSSYAPSYGSSYVPQIQQIQIPQASYYYQQQQPNIVPYIYPIGQQNTHKKKKRRKRPICCCSTSRCLEGCSSTNTDCACDIRCCRRYNATNPGCPLTIPRDFGVPQLVFLKQFDDDFSEDFYNEEIPEKENVDGTE